MMWLENITCDVIKYWVRSSPSCKFVCTKDGKIAWANLEFCNWIGSPLQEILHKDIENFIMHTSSDSPNKTFDDVYLKDENSMGISYKIHRRLIPNNKSGRWGSLFITKHPPIGDTEFFLCTWDPVDYDNSELLQTTLLSMDKLSNKVEALTDEIGKLCAIEDEATWASSTIKMIKKYPKTAIMILVLVLGSFGVSNILNILIKVGLLPEVVTVAP